MTIQKLSDGTFRKKPLKDAKINIDVINRKRKDVIRSIESFRDFLTGSEENKSLIPEVTKIANRIKTLPIK